MRTVWTNETYANWLKDNGVIENEEALVELKWDGKQRLPFKVISKALKREDIKLPNLNDQKWYTYLNYKKLSTGSFSIGGSMEFQVRSK